jgi:hypothetical protein
MGAVVSQMDKDGSLRPIGFYSRKFSAAEVNYEIHDKELLAIIEGFKNWRHYCIGTELPVQVFTDHNNLRYFMSSRYLNRRQARWSLFLADYNFEMVVRPGSQQVVSDALSRQESMRIQPQDEEFTVNEKILLTKDKFNCKERSSNLLPLKLKDSVLINSLDSSDEESSLASNSDYDGVDYQSSVSLENEFDDDDIFAVGDVNQFAEFEGGSIGSPDPLWFQYMLQYLWKGDLPYVLIPALLNKIKRLSQTYMFKDIAYSR